jgi:hypothetical protein
VTKKIRFEEAQHWIKLSRGGALRGLFSTAEYTTIYHDLPRTARFWSVLFAVERELAEKTRTSACPCGGRLHSADFLRKPRGAPARLAAAGGAMLRGGRDQRLDGPIGGDCEARGRAGDQAGRDSARRSPSTDRLASANAPPKGKDSNPRSSKREGAETLLKHSPQIYSHSKELNIIAVPRPRNTWNGSLEESREHNGLCSVEGRGNRFAKSGIGEAEDQGPSPATGARG